MPTGRPTGVEIALTVEARASLEELPPSHSILTAWFDARRSILASAAGDSNTAIAPQVRLGLPAIGQRPLSINVPKLAP